MLDYIRPDVVHVLLDGRIVKTKNNQQQGGGQFGGQNQQQGGGKNKKGKKGQGPVKQVELTDEEVAKQVKETLARLTTKQMKKGVKYRKEKRENIHNRMAELEEEENAESKVLKLTEFVTANDLATMMNIPVTKVIGTCMSIGIMVSINQRLDAETINLVAEEFGFSTSYVSEEVSNAVEEVEDNPEDLVPRAPIITVMGHVDQPCVQIYSCRGSVYWMGKAFLGLLVPEDNPFWTAKENNGPWEKEFKKNQVYNHFMPGTNILVTNYPNLGASEIRAWCKEKVASDWQKFRSGENYNKFAYNTAFPWMADGKNGEVSQNYAILNNKGEWEVLRLYDFVSFEDGIYRRDAVLETDENVKFNLAEIPLPNGVLRVDRVTLPKAYQGQNHSLRLGSYTIPKLKENIKTGSFTEPRLTYYVDNGVYQIAMCDLKDGQAVKNQIVTGKDMHPMSESCS